MQNLQAFHRSPVCRIATGRPWLAWPVKMQAAAWGKPGFNVGRALSCPSFDARCRAADLAACCRGPSMQIWALQYLIWGTREIPLQALWALASCTMHWQAMGLGLILMSRCKAIHIATTHTVAGADRHCHCNTSLACARV